MEALTWIARGKPMSWAEVMKHKDNKEIYEAAQSACGRLREALIEGQVSAWALPNGSRADDLRELGQVDPRWFRDGLYIHPDGQAAPLHPHSAYEGARFERVEFDPNQLRAKFRKAETDLTAWMRRKTVEYQSARNGQFPKRDDLIRDCMEAFNCTRAKARDAHAALPEQARNMRGRPKRK